MSKRKLVICTIMLLLLFPATSFAGEIWSNEEWDCFQCHSDIQIITEQSHLLHPYPAIDCSACHKIEDPPLDPDYYKCQDCHDYCPGYVPGPQNTPPATNAGNNLAIYSTDQDTTIIQGTATDIDNDPLTYRWLEGTTVLSSSQAVGENGETMLDLSTVPDFSIGDHTLTLEVSDGQDISADEMILTINNSSPNAAPTGAGTYQIFDPVSLGGQVSDFDGDSLSYEWLDVGNMLFSGQVQAIYGGDPVDLQEHVTTDLSLGAHIITLRVSDGTNQPVESDMIVEVVDTQDPTLAPVPDSTILWPPNHQMVDISIHANASDNGGGVVTLTASVSSNEPEDGLGDGDIAPDWTQPQIDQNAGIITFQLRAERSGSGDGRVYTVSIAATDESNNSSTVAVEIIVPHDRRKK